MDRGVPISLERQVCRVGAEICLVIEHLELLETAIEDIFALFTRRVGNICSLKIAKERAISLIELHRHKQLLQNQLSIVRVHICMFRVKIRKFKHYRDVSRRQIFRGLVRI